ncbi:hypothetical protein [Roseovarius aquimarinus]|uniref:Tat pathway signal sequence domain protein n=1 Tax=Roseovarius aquimarinus TaxID=1229156 RepID=A0ABW7I5L0_9RHOB
MKQLLSGGIGACLALASATMIAAAPAQAEEEIGAHLVIELNAAADQAEGCKLSFLALNGHATDIAGAVFETVLFDAEGQVDRLTLLDFADLPAARPRVRQFVISGMACDDIGQVLFNGASICEAGDLGAGACTEGLELTSRTGIEVTG